MSASAAPPLFFQQLNPNNSGAPAIGFQLFVYDAGTSNKATTWTDSTQGTVNPNPLILDANGGANLYGDPSIAYKLVWAPPNDTDPPQSPLRTVDNLFFPLTLEQITQPFVAGLIYPRTQAEIIAGVTPTTLIYPQGVPFRYGVAANGSQDDTPPMTVCLLVGVYTFWFNGSYTFQSKVQVTNSYPSIVGESRQNTIVQAASGFADYMIEIGNGTIQPNAGHMERLRFFGQSGNLGMIHMNTGCSMWRINDIVFSPSLCPAIVMDQIFDSNYTNIDILTCNGTGANPATNAAVILRGNCNNIYFRGLRMEQCKSGCIYVNGSGPIYIDTGKIDMGNAAGQLASPITVATGYQNGEGPAQLDIDNFQISGVLNQYPVNLAGSLRLGNVDFGGGTNTPAHILDTRAWFAIDATTWTGAAAGFFGPAIGLIDLGRASFHYGTPFINDVTPAVLYSQLPAQRVLVNTSVTANGSTGANSRNCAISAIAYNGQYVGCYLVHNPTGNQPGSRRKILASFTGGNVTVQGTASLTQDSDWSIEYSGGHATPNLRADGIAMDNGMDLFAKLSTGCVLGGTPTYVASTNGATPGVTLVTITGSGLVPSQNITGMFLIDEVTGEPFLIGYGIDGSSNIGVMYNVSATLNTAHTFTVQAGYKAGVQINGDSYEWTFAGKKKTALISASDTAGFDLNNIPLWGGVTTGEVITLPYSASITLDASTANQFIITATNTSNFTINTPVGGSVGQIILITLANASGGSFGTITWGSGFKVPSGIGYAANTFQRTYEYQFRGTSWYYITAASLDVPN